MTTVPGAGRTPCPVMFIGEAPGEVEAARGEPFIGPSGVEQDLYLSKTSARGPGDPNGPPRPGYLCRQFYRTNLVKTYLPGNPDPTPSLVAQWRATLREELIACRPRLIVTVGAFATWEFLRTSSAPATDKPEPYFLTGKVHGVAHYVSPQSPHIYDVDLDAAYRTVVLPVIHPAAGMRATDEALAFRSKIFWDYAQVSAAIDLVMADKPIPVAVDIHAGQEDYRVISPRDLPLYLPFNVPEFAIDTEGEPGNAFSLQFSYRAGTGYMLLVDDQDYLTFAAPYLQCVIDNGARVLMHSRYELEMATDIHLDFSRANIIDTMYLAYPLLVEPQGLKELAHRHCGMEMASHEEIVKPIGTSRQVGYLEEVVRRANRATIDLTGIGVKVPRARKIDKSKRKPVNDLRLFAVLDIAAQLGRVNLHAQPSSLSTPKTVTVSEWPIPPRRQILENDGTVSAYKPAPVANTATTILADFRAGKLDSNGKPVNLRKRWLSISDNYRGIGDELRGPVESVLGRFPYGSIRSLYDSDREAAVRYSCRDPDATWRWGNSTDGAAQPKLANFHGTDLRQLCAQGSYLSTVVNEMQGRGIPIHIPSLRALAVDLESSMRTIGALLSLQFWDSRPFNPNSSDQVQTLMARRGLIGGKRTQSGGWSTSKSSIEGLRYTDPAMAMVFDWREHEHTLSAFIYPVLDSIPADYHSDLWRVHGRIKNTRTTSRRFSAAKDDDGTGTNLLAWPKHSKFGKALRTCCRAPEGFKFVTCDYKQIEVRGMAHKSGDPLMIAIICRRAEDGWSEVDRDFHTQTAAKLFDVRPEDVKEDTQRTPSKRITFGVGYGLRGYGLANQLQSFGIQGWPPDRCEEFIAEWFKLYKGYAEYNAQCEREAQARGMCFDDWGMPRYLPGVWSRDRKIAAESARQYVSHKIQGWAQGVIQNAMCALKPIVLDWQGQSVLGSVYWLLQEHDALVFEVKDEAVEMVKAVVPHVMTTAHGVVGCRVPIEVDVKVTSAWGVKS